MPPLRAWLLLSICASLLIGASGCKMMKVPDPSLWFRREPQTQAGIITPHERHLWLEQVAKQADSLEPAEQEDRAQELAQAIQKEEDPGLRGEILRTLGRLPTATSERVLQAARNDTDADVRIACCEAWGQRGGPTAVKSLVETMNKDADIDVRLSAVRELGNLGDPSVVPELGKLLEDRDPAMQHRVVQSLRALTGKEFGDDVNAWREFTGGGNPPEQPLAARLFRWF